MKRSEMLKKITDIVHLHRRHTEGVTSEQLAKMILDEVEELGMMPPERVLKDAGTYYVNEWSREEL